MEKDHLRFEHDEATHVLSQPKVMRILHLCEP